jgi:hypothetical protein
LVGKGSSKRSPPLGQGATVTIGSCVRSKAPSSRFPWSNSIEQTSSQGRLQRLVHGYLQALFSQATLCVACNAVHHVAERCARWLLQAHDRVDGDTFNLTQEYLAAMLGTGRPAVSIAASALQEAGFIQYTRGSIAILARQGLESVACQCYEDIRSEYSRLVPLVAT